MADDEDSVEIWRDIPGYEKYEVSSFGRVRKKAQILKPWRAGSDYDYIGLGRQYRGTVHRLVCRAFNGAPPSPDHKCVAHWDGDRRNNRAGNLRWATYSENLADACRHETSKLNQYRTDGYQPKWHPINLRGENHPRAKLSAAKASQIRQRHSRGESMQKLADAFGVTKSTIFRVVSGAAWSAKGQ